MNTILRVLSVLGLALLGFTALGLFATAVGGLLGSLVKVVYWAAILAGLVTLGSLVWRWAARKS